MIPQVYGEPARPIEVRCLQRLLAHPDHRIIDLALAHAPNRRLLRRLGVGSEHPITLLAGVRGVPDRRMGVPPGAMLPARVLTWDTGLGTRRWLMAAAVLEDDSWWFSQPYPVRG